LTAQERQTVSEMAAEGANLAERHTMMEINGSLMVWNRIALSMITLREESRT